MKFDSRGKIAETQSCSCNPESPTSEKFSKTHAKCLNARSYVNFVCPSFFDIFLVFNLRVPTKIQNNSVLFFRGTLLFYTQKVRRLGVANCLPSHRILADVANAHLSNLPMHPCRPRQRSLVDPNQRPQLSFAKLPFYTGLQLQKISGLTLFAQFFISRQTIQKITCIA